MERIRLIYEQIEEAKHHLLSNSALRLRLALILLDNAAELLMYRRLCNKFGHDDAVTAPMIARSENLGIPIPDDLRPLYSAKERRDAERYFDGMTRLLDKRLHEISRDDRTVLDIAHRIRRDVYHRGLLRLEILLPVCRLLFHTVVGLTRKLNPRHVAVGTLNDEQKSFLERFGIAAAHHLIDDEMIEHIGALLLQDVQVDLPEFSTVLGDDLVLRIDEGLGGLEDIGGTKDELELDQLL